MKTTDQQSGLRFEKWISHLYDELGKLRVRHNVIITHTSKHGRAKSQFDVVFGLLHKTYVECKYRGNHEKVTYHDVAAFAGKLKLIGAGYYQGIVITNSTYEIRAKMYAQKAGLQLIDGKETMRLHKKRLGFVRRLRDNDTLENIIRHAQGG